MLMMKRNDIKEILNWENRTEVYLDPYALELEINCGMKSDNEIELLKEDNSKRLCDDVKIDHGVKSYIEIESLKEDKFNRLYDDIEAISRVKNDQIMCDDNFLLGNTEYLDDVELYGEDKLEAQICDLLTKRKKTFRGTYVEFLYYHNYILLCYLDFPLHCSKRCQCDKGLSELYSGQKRSHLPALRSDVFNYKHHINGRSGKMGSYWSENAAVRVFYYGDPFIRIKSKINMENNRQNVVIRVFYRSELYTYIKDKISVTNDKELNKVANIASYDDIFIHLRHGISMAKFPYFGKRFGVINGPNIIIVHYINLTNVVN